jgi:hypothetical protein
VRTHQATFRCELLPHSRYGPGPHIGRPPQPSVGGPSDLRETALDDPLTADKHYAVATSVPKRVREGRQRHVAHPAAG